MEEWETRYDIFDIETVPSIPPEDLIAKMKLPVPKKYQKNPREFTHVIGKDMSLDPWYGKIAAISWFITEVNEAHYSAGPDEKKILTDFWTDLRKNHVNYLVTYFGQEFDCPWLIVRSIYNDIKPTMPVNLSKYRFENHIDLYQFLVNWKSFGVSSRLPHKLAGALRCMGIKPPAQDVSADDIYDLYKAGDFETIASKSNVDVSMTLVLFNKMKPVLDIYIQQEEYRQMKKNLFNNQ